MMPRLPTSEVLAQALGTAPGDRVTVAWLLERLGERSFGIILLLLAILALLPGVSPLAGILLAVPALQMLRGQALPRFPARLAGRPIPTRRLMALVARVVPVLRWLERFVRPRWPTPFGATRRVVGAVVLVLGACLFAPLPLSNLPPALAILLIAFAYLEEDGLLLAAALAGALAIPAALLLLAWEAMGAAGWVPGLV